PRLIARGRYRTSHIGKLTLWVPGLERVELAPEEAATARPPAGQDRDVPGDICMPYRQLMAADRADRGMLNRRVGTITGLHQVRAALVVPLLAHHRPDQGDRAHLLGQLLVPLGELDAGDRGRDRLRAGGTPGSGVRVERLELARAAVQPEQDD